MITHTLKASQLITILSQLPENHDPDIVTGETWLPERLVRCQQDEALLFLTFDSAPDEGEEDEARGFVEHEVDYIKARLHQLITSGEHPSVKTEAILALVLFAHEHSSSDVIEMLEQTAFAAQNPLDESTSTETAKITTSLSQGLTSTFDGLKLGES